MTDTNRQMTCCFTGHRKIPAEKLPILKRQLDEALEALIAEGVIYFGAGGALGFDTLAAEAVLRAKDKHPEVRLILVLPCPEQARFWRKEDAAHLEHLRSLADKVTYVSPVYTRACMYERNRHLADHAGTCIYYLTEERGGTHYTVHYAQKHGLRLIPLADSVLP